MTMNSLPSTSREDPAIVRVPDRPHCYRHRPDLPHQRLASEASVQGIQHELQTLSPKSQEIITSIWTFFSDTPDKERRILIDGILARCCFSQLSHMSTSIKELIKIDFLAALPEELSYHILQYLDTTSLCRAAQVSQHWRKLTNDDVIWYRMCEQHINKKCSRCGWSLPLLQQQERLAQSQNMYISESSRPWKDVYKERFEVGLNWKYGRYKTIVLQGHTDSVMCLQIYDTFLATGSYDATICLWNLYSGELIRTFLGHTAGIRALRFDDHKIISGSLDRTIKVWNWRTGQCILSLLSHDEGVIGLDVAGNTLASGSKDETIKIWDFEKKEGLTLRGHTGGVNSVKFDPASRTLISASDDFTVRLWDLDTRQCIRVFEGHCGQVQHALFLLPEIEHEHSLESSFLAETLSADCERSLEGNPRPNLRASYGNGFSAHPERPLPPLYVMSGSLDNTLRLWNTASGVCVRISFGHTEGIWSIAVDSLRAISGAGDSVAKVWDVVTGDCVRTLTGHTRPVTCVALTDSVTCTGSDDCRVIVSHFKPPRKVG
ncbi:quinon protein alcohol dehydrogenase-like superfamily [Xylariaceae sp. FL0662B]|nr:quinon protein alcohol dehydrogenase-like superfamily [Xylariaceae sp. FL0662B]